MSHREAVRAVAGTLAIVLAGVVLVSLVILAGWGLIALYLLVVPASWVAPLTIGLVVVAGIAYFAFVLYLAYRRVDLTVAILLAPCVILLWLLSKLPLPKGIRAVLEE